MVVALVILIFLWHVPSAMIPILTIPVAVLISFIPMRMMGMSSNIMSLGGIAIAVGAMVDAAIVVVEQTHKKLEHADPSWTTRDYQHAIVTAVKEVGGPSFFALLVIAVSFLPVLTLEAQEGRLFKPLAYTKNFAMIVAAVLAITLDPALRLFFFRKENFRLRPRWLARIVNGVLVGTIHSEEKHPISRVLMRLYEPVVALEPALEVAGDRGRGGAGGGHRAGVPEARLGIHAAARRRRAALHADHAAGHFGRRGAEADAGAGPHPDAVPGSGARAGQGRPRRDVHRSGAVLDDGDDRPAEAEGPVAPEHHVHRPAGHRDERRADASRASRTPGPCRSRTASTC